MIEKLAEKGEFDTGDISGAFMTQININQIRETMENLSLPFETLPLLWINTVIPVRRPSPWYLIKL